MRCSTSANVFFSMPLIRQQAKEQVTLTTRNRQRYLRKAPEVKQFGLGSVSQSVQPLLSCRSVQMPGTFLENKALQSLGTGKYLKPSIYWAPLPLI